MSDGCYEEFSAIPVTGDGYTYASPYNGEVLLNIKDSNTVACAGLSPLAARALAAQLLKAARWAEGDRT